MESQIFQCVMTRSPSRSRSRRSRSFDSRGEESHTLAVFNLYYRTDEDELRRIFERYGRIEVFFILSLFNLS